MGMNSDGSICYTPIGIIHSPYAEPSGMPIQPSGALGVRGSIVVDPRFCDGLKDLDGYSHIVLLYHLHRSAGPLLRVTPFLDTESRGVFSTRAPRRPNPIGLSVVRLVSVEGGELTVENIDILDGTPLLDIKPYIPEMDVYQVERTGWFGQSQKSIDSTRADDRFD
jgi:tRNA-Thr(GGU) m(6)t(6)A37 methyltransferase TsaA